MKNQFWESSHRGQFNTLAQNGTGAYGKPAIIVTGKGTELISNKTLKGRAKRKTITQTTMLSLIDISDKNFTPDRKKGYWNTYHCQNKIYTANGKMYGKYCKNRFCTLCCSIRKAEIINKYLPVLKDWSDPQFVTLTIKAQPLKNLNVFMSGMIKGFKRITQKYRKQHQRGKGFKLVGIRSLECNYNPIRKTYNPHFHLIVENKEIANTLQKEWLKLWTSNYTNIAAQKIDPLRNTQSALLELIKYGSKIFTEPDVNKKSKIKGSPQINVAALNNIFIAMKGLRIFERFGFNLPKQNIIREAAKVVSDYSEWVFDLRHYDWLNTENELTLTGYTPEKELINLLENNIDTDLE